MPGTTPLTDATGQDIVTALQALTAVITAQTAQLSELIELCRAYYGDWQALHASVQAGQPYTPTPYT